MEEDINLNDIAKKIHYPEHWDTSVYNTIYDAIYEAINPCSECEPNGPEYWTTETDRGFREVMMAKPSEVECLGPGTNTWQSHEGNEIKFIISDIRRGFIYRIKNPNYKPPQRNPEFGMEYESNDGYKFIYVGNIRGDILLKYIDEQAFHKTDGQDFDANYKFTGKTIDLSALIGEDES